MQRPQHHRGLTDELRGHSITYRIALGPHAGRKALTLRTLPSSGEFEQGLARANGFSLHAGVVAAADERDKLERLCRYITRPAVSTDVFVTVGAIGKTGWTSLHRDALRRRRASHPSICMWVTLKRDSVGASGSCGAW